MTANEPVSWDAYAARHAITEDEAPQAFAAFLHEASDGQWDGETEQVDDDDHAVEPPDQRG